MVRTDYKHDPDTDFRGIDDLSKEQAQREVEALREAIDYHDPNVSQR